MELKEEDKPVHLIKLLSQICVLENQEFATADSDLTCWGDIDSLIAYLQSRNFCREEIGFFDCDDGITSEQKQTILQSLPRAIKPMPRSLVVIK